MAVFFLIYVTIWGIAKTPKITVRSSRFVRNERENWGAKYAPVSFSLVSIPDVFSFLTW